MTLLSYAFRPFFLLGALYAGIIIPLWLLVLLGRLDAGSHFGPMDWHVHEALFGYVAAIIGGFLLTAIPNWTGRPPVRGAALGGLVLLWLAGRVAITCSGTIGWLTAAILDCLFLPALAAVAAREVIAARNWRNLRVVAPLILFSLANLLFHYEVREYGASIYAGRLAIAAVIVLILIIGGRIIPAFTRNWLMRANPGRLPAPFGRFDGATLLLSLAALLVWILEPLELASGLLLLGAGALNLVRLARWAGDRALRDGLVLVLHLGYLFVPLGFLFSGLAALDPGLFPPVAGLHAFGAGAIGIMTLAVMTRASLGHTGRPLHADGATCLIYLAAVAAATLRILAAFLPDVTFLLHASATFWALAFLGFCLRYGGLLLRAGKSS